MVENTRHRESSSSQTTDDETIAEVRQTPPVIDTEKNSAPDFPDGGLDAWLVVLGAWCVSFSTFGYVNAFGVYQDYYQIHQLSQYSSSDISWIGSLQLFFIFSLGLFVGRLFDAGYLRLLTVIGTFFLVFGIMMTSLAKEYYQIILAQGVTIGLGLGLLFIPSVSCVSHWFRRRRALALGILATGSSTGGIVLPILLNQCIKKPSIGYGWGVRASGFLVLGLLIIANFTLKTRLPPRKSGAIIEFSVFRDLPYSLFCLAAFFIMWGMYLPFFYTPSYILYEGMSQNLSFYSLAILNAASVFGRTIPNYLADKSGPQNMLIPCVLLSAILMFAWIGATNVGGMITFLILYGFSSGAYVSIVPACVAGLTSNMNEIGLRMGMVFLCISVAALTGTPIMGAIIKAQGGKYWGSAICAGVMMLIGVALAVIGRSFHSRNKGTWKV